ncbi:GDSL-like Lipase/Acylhydrolase [Paraphoma chrysanthemicola]|uniref:GDSL-like Lipase/Acylhydrolase n=1 Tax=Paraphoma chrysanthemicola TaxID=798071 RepID=A0A8K0W2P9_9PLEO|nr:GDSL-like Lipase/Acylhydrolase [Paraphoma chrysanthemicola]
MWHTQVAVLGLLGSLATALPQNSPRSQAARVPTVFIAGDSTTAPLGSGTGTQGWGEYLKYSLGSNAKVNNSAVAGRSTRSYTREGRFAGIAAAMQPGDWVIIEFGINDGGSGVPVNGSTSTTGDKGRAVCPGMGNEICTVVYGGVVEQVKTFPTYVKAAARTFLSRGAAGIIIAEQLPRDTWQTGTFKYTPTVFSWYDWTTVSQLGGPAANVYYVQHGSYAAQAQKLLGYATVEANYPNDHTHTSPFLADVHSKAFAMGLKCGTSPLKNLVVNATTQIQETVGPCIPHNSTLPV